MSPARWEEKWAIFDVGWPGCLDPLAQLNQTVKSVGFIRPGRALLTSLPHRYIRYGEGEREGDSLAFPSPNAVDRQAAHPTSRGEREEGGIGAFVDRD